MTVTAAKVMHLQGYGIAQWSDASFELLLTRYKKKAFRYRANWLRVG